MADNDIVMGGQQPKKVEALRPGEERLRLELKLATAETEKLRTENDSLRELTRDFYAVLEHTADFVYVKDAELKYTNRNETGPKINGNVHAHHRPLLVKNVRKVPGNLEHQIQ